VNGGAAARGPVPAGLAERLFERLYERYDLLLIEGTNVAVPKDGTAVVPAGRGPVQGCVRWCDPAPAQALGAHA
jgi:hypothetical protein